MKYIFDVYPDLSKLMMDNYLRLERASLERMSEIERKRMLARQEEAIIRASGMIIADYGRVRDDLLDSVTYTLLSLQPKQEKPMSLKVSVISAAEKPEKPFPKLMKSNSGIVVLFTESRRGTVVAGSSFVDPIGRMSETWNMHVFEDFDGSVTLSNV